MEKNTPIDHSLGDSSQSEFLDLPSFSKSLDSFFSQGKSLNVEGTNVVRVPFGTRRPLRQRPEGPERLATLVLPFQPMGSPTPPPQAA